MSTFPVILAAAPAQREILRIPGFDLDLWFCPAGLTRIAAVPDLASPIP